MDNHLRAKSPSYALLLGGYVKEHLDFGLVMTGNINLTPNYCSPYFIWSKFASGFPIFLTFPYLGSFLKFREFQANQKKETWTEKPPFIQNDWVTWDQGLYKLEGLWVLVMIWRLVECPGTKNSLVTLNHLWWPRQNDLYVRPQTKVGWGYIWCQRGNKLLLWAHGRIPIKVTLFQLLNFQTWKTWLKER